MSDLIDECRSLGIEFDKTEMMVEKLQDTLWEAERERTNMEEAGEDTTLQDIAIHRLRQKLNDAIAEIKS